MSHLTEMSSESAFRGTLPPWQPCKLDDSVFELTKALGPHWVIEPWTGCGGDLSIIVFARHDPNALPTFVLFEQDGVARVATVQNDEWARDRRFRSLRLAAGALIARAALAAKQYRDSTRHHAALN